MKTKISFSAVVALCLLFGTNARSFALSYTISFTASGATASVGDVAVQNLTKGTSVTVLAGNVLNLTNAPTSIDEPNANNENIHIVLGAIAGESTLSFYSPHGGSTQLNIYSMDGRKIAGLTYNIDAGNNFFKLILPRGTFAIHVAGRGFDYTAKVQNKTFSNTKPEVAFLNAEKPALNAPQKSKKTLGVTTLAYSAGDQLLYNGTSGNYSTLVTDNPTGDKTINFEYVACQDGSGNNYAVVKIGTQTWMVENLKAIHYRYGESIPNVTNNTTWVALTTGSRCEYTNTDANGVKYGNLYNLNAVTDIRNIAPIGWHVPTNTEWITLENYVGSHLGSSSNLANGLITTSDWGYYSNTKNNSSLFSALPGGYRSDNGTFITLPAKAFGGVQQAIT